eukprot:Opistho-2@17334
MREIHTAGIVISNCAKLVDISALNGIVSVTGGVSLITLGMQHLPHFRSLVRIVSGGLIISDNAFMQDVTGFDALTAVDGGIVIRYNPALTHIGGYPRLTTVRGDVQISDNILLRAVTGMSSLESLMGSLAIMRCPCVDASGFASLSILRDTLYIFRTYLGSLSFFNSLKRAGGVEVTHNKLLVVVNMVALSTVEGSLKFDENDMLVQIDVTDFGNLTSIGGLSVVSLDALRAINGFRALRTIGGDLSLSDNGALALFSGFESLTTITGSFVCARNTVVDGVDLELDFVGSVEFSDNSNANFMRANIREVGGGMTVRGNIALETVVVHVEHIQGDLTFGANDAFQSNNPDSGAEMWHIGRVNSVAFTNNRQLTSLDLSSVYNVTGAFAVDDNEALADVLLPRNFAQVESISVTGNNVLQSLTYTVPFLNLAAELSPTHDVVFTPLASPPLNVTGRVVITGHQLIEVSFLHKLEYIGSDFVFAAPSRSLIAAPNLTYIGGSLIIQTSLLTNMFPSLSRIGGSLMITPENGTKATWSDFPALVTVGGAVVVSNSIGLRSIAGFQSLVTIGAFLQISNNRNLLSVDGMALLRTVGASRFGGALFNNTFAVAIFGNSALTQIRGLSQVSRVAGPVIVSSNPHLCAREVDLTLVATGESVVNGNSEFDCVCQGRIVRSDTELLTGKNCILVVGNLVISNVTSLSPMYSALI